mmetsp:Transcript_29240/g.29607  ORF Transcript_29240/g.29607 Transcript_29240/m.29607 type:complete len:499 (+) Transcript_29240:211-1707(+)|eukprot:CAMPEP_0182427332 /NCGR_PEP_ID=MMETSP1167-20130531/17090_1 /TAXON_ID=2988 /ORGANISM="Mallomonas Sp, Strain CCMP3275" /LENGTH=498 /DNA_ID=CAMNT_0024609499 /DNA_START=187 /DNA_END=1683 /DNA_ORIENTATION=-
MSSVSKEYSPDIVSQSFIKQYYDMLARNPSELHRFYKEDSSFIHSDGVQISEVANGVESIREHINNLDLAGARVDLTDGSVDAQKSENNGVFLTVTGHVTLASRPTRPFVQSFFLASQSSGNPKSPQMISYFVRNSIFRLLGNPFTEADLAVKPTAVPEPALDPIVDEMEPTSYMDVRSDSVKVPMDHALLASMNQASLEPTTHEIPADEIDVNAPQEEIQVEEPQEEEEEEEEVEEQDYPEEIEMEEVGQEELVPETETYMEPPPPSPPKSFADVVKRLAGEKAAPVPPPVPHKGRSSSSKKEKRFDESEPVASMGAKPIALYISHITADTTDADLLQIFSVFGEVKHADVHASRGYAFIEFTEPSAAHAALSLAEIEPFNVKGQDIKVEERQTRSKSRDKAAGPGPGHREREKDRHADRDGSHSRDRGDSGREYVRERSDKSDGGRRGDGDVRGDGTGRGPRRDGRGGRGHRYGGAPGNRDFERENKQNFKMNPKK